LRARVNKGLFGGKRAVFIGSGAYRFRPELEPERDRNGSMRRRENKYYW